MEVEEIFVWPLFDQAVYVTILGIIVLVCSVLDQATQTQMTDSHGDIWI